MSRNVALCIGINGYDYQKNLTCAVNDAEAMRHFCYQEAQFEMVYFFSDTSPPIPGGGGAVFKSQPTFGNVHNFLVQRFHQPFLSPEDNLWFFFAGHGRQESGCDYLMLADSSPDTVTVTGLAVRSIADRLRRSGAGNVVMLLDACRSDGSRNGEGIGRQIQQGVVTFYACSPSQSSYEIEALGQGAFTHALLQGLRIMGEGNCATVERLNQHLSYQVPLLCQNHGKTQQIPYMVPEPASKSHLILLPEKANLADVNTLKLDAYKAQQQGDLDLAEELWKRVLAIAKVDADALDGLYAIRDCRRDTPRPITPVPDVPMPTPQGRGRATPPAPEPPAPANARPQPSNPKPDPVPDVPMPKPPERRSGVGQSLATPPAPEPPAPANARPQPSSPKTPQPRPSEPPRPQSATAEQKRTQRPPLDRRKFLKILGFTVGGSVVAGVGSRLIADLVSPSTYREDLGNGITLELAQIPGGKFLMGSPTSESEREENEGPQQEITVPPFLMGRYAVTQAQWRQVAAWPQVSRSLKPDPSQFKGDTLPVEQVSWYEAEEFCQRLSAATGQIYRLPTEAEWEYACRAGTTTPFFFGESLTPNLANYGGNQKTTTPVGRFPANSWGLYDLHGNVWEWCLDQWHDSYQGKPEALIKDGSIPWTKDSSAISPSSDESTRLLRGGSWYNIPRYCRSAYRYRGSPDDQNYSIGFRVVGVVARTLS